jgi:hypothetical protein
VTDRCAPLRQGERVPSLRLTEQHSTHPRHGLPTYRVDDVGVALGGPVLGPPQQVHERLGVDAAGEEEDGGGVSCGVTTGHWKVPPRLLELAKRLNERSP